MSLKKAIEADLKQALLSRDKLKSDTLKMVKSAILNEEIANNKRQDGLTDDEIIACLKKEAKKRNEAADLYKKAKSIERANKELAEVEVINKYLPEQMTDTQVIELIKESFLTHAKEQKNLGKVIADVKIKSENRADSAQIAKLAKEFLTQ